MSGAPEADRVAVRRETAWREANRDRFEVSGMGGTPEQRLTAMLGDILERHVEPIFKPGVKLTIIARTPGNNEADVIVGDDDLPAVAALIVRSAARSPVGGAP